jgi:hypothetical protein
MQLEKEGGKPTGSIHMRIAKIQQDPKEKIVIKIFNGTNEIYLRAQNIGLALNWFNALTKASKSCNEGRYNHLKSKGTARMSAAPNLNGSYYAGGGGGGSIKSPSKPASESGRLSVAGGGGEDS